ncbi:MAG: phosphate acyltransferase PlsX [Thiotrichales bacterium]|nr:phosphate acyltransferase PlsX [Thiotrichales bacterium]
MGKRYTIALDAMGGDHGPNVVVPAAFGALAESTDVDLVLVGNEPAIDAALRLVSSASDPRISILHASQSVEMDDSPSQVLRSKQDSSMRVAIDLVRDGKADACVSAGNTGALMAMARFVLKTLPGIDRPAIISELPTAKGHTHVLDLGANVESTSRHLFEFAVMGSELVSAVDDIERPKVGLLNVGQEGIKGNERVKEAARLLASSNLHYIGFVEGDDIYAGTVDVVVCDGFVGNVALKSSEGVARMISGLMREEFGRSLSSRVAGLLARPVLRRLAGRMDPRSYNGASFVGLRGIVIKSHGRADVVAFKRAIMEAVAEIRKNVPERISERIASVLLEKEAV